MKSLPLMLNPNTSEDRDNEAYLRLKLDSQTQIVVPMKQAKEAILVSPYKITPLPNMPWWVIGLLNQRSRVFWVIDLPRLLQLSSPQSNRQEYPMVIMQVDGIPIGLIVEEIQGVVHFPQEMIQSPIGKVSSGLVPYLKGCILQPEIGILLVLDPQSIINTPVGSPDIAREQ